MEAQTSVDWRPVLESDVTPSIRGEMAVSPLEIADGLVKLGFDNKVIEQLVLAYYASRVVTPYVGSGGSRRGRSLASRGRSASRASSYYSQADELPSQDGCCYLWLLRPKVREKVWSNIGRYPTFGRLITQLKEDELAVTQWRNCYLTQVEKGFHLSRQEGGIPLLQALAGFEFAVPGVMTGPWLQAIQGVEPYDAGLTFASKFGGDFGILDRDFVASDIDGEFPCMVSEVLRYSGFISPYDKSSDLDLSFRYPEEESALVRRGIESINGVRPLQAAVVQVGRDVEVGETVSATRWLDVEDGQVKTWNFCGSFIVRLEPGQSVMLSEGQCLRSEQDEVWIRVVGTVRWRVNGFPRKKLFAYKMIDGELMEEVFVDCLQVIKAMSFALHDVRRGRFGTDVKKNFCLQGFLGDSVSGPYVVEARPWSESNASTLFASVLVGTGSDLVGCDGLGLVRGCGDDVVWAQVALSVSDMWFMSDVSSLRENEVAEMD